MTSLARRFLSVWISAALTWSASTARAADPDPSSETHAQRGIELRGEGRNREALAEFEAAYALQPTARNRAQIALARQALGEWVQAEEGLEAALVEGADPWVLRYHEALERALEVVRRHLGWLDVETNASGAELFVDGTRVGALPRAEPLRLAAGSVEIEIRAPGYATLRQTSTVTANVRTRERVALLPAPVVDPGIEEPAAPATESEAPPPAEANVAVAPRLEPRAGARQASSSSAAPASLPSAARSRGACGSTTSTATTVTPASP